MFATRKKTFWLMCSPEIYFEVLCKKLPLETRLGPDFWYTFFLACLRSSYPGCFHEKAYQNT